MTPPATMIALVEEYLAHRRGMGFLFHDDKDGGELRGFGRYADRLGHLGPLTIVLAVDWAKDTKYAAPIHHARRLDLVRGFARYRALFDPRTEIPAKGTLGPSRYPRRSPYIYSEAEIAALLRATAAIRPTGSLRPHTYHTLFGLLACTGLRVSEALALTDDAVDWEQGVLEIRRTKFQKTRWVALHASAVEALERYRARRNGCVASRDLPAFLVTDTGRSLVYPQIQSRFRALRSRLGWTAEGRTRVPRIHDLRHTFAVRRLLQWYEDGSNVDSKITALATYLGHVNVTKTYWYLTAVPELLAVVSARFEQFARAQNGGDP
jgi:integrase